MPRLASLALFALCIISLPAIASASAIHSTSSREIARSKYTKSHSLGDSYTFDPRDGWQAFNATNLDYKYRREPSKKKTSTGEKQNSIFKSLTTSFSTTLNSAINGLKGLGRPEKGVVITWYTGHDLLNPSCWANTPWAPTVFFTVLHPIFFLLRAFIKDESFVCALTLQGWDEKPKCFKFLELCVSPKKCVFVRVVDTCAGCAAGSKHVDLTRSAFSQLADLDEGITTVQYRPASKPTQWFEEIWGPEE
ncbi:hypothetical protein C8F04DRAFT_9245 [Mycena alexandri]|uniref:RlpA-like protein double-psi beta-barrel domain-containing protein n=1 Tax=Mycena alexandri TaxID=1745969 RepID=A0AAD6TMA1_9AGAR|nr:hypothetical protein C8F04DRAFT_9245 [Mycena alexandri]